jgi:hypothetical protein
VLTAELREFAQCPDRFTMISPDVDRVVHERFCLIQGNVWAGVSAVRVAAHDVEALVADVRERVAREKHLVWWIDPDAQPPDLESRLERCGLRRPDDGGYEVHALVCTSEPEAGPESVSTRRVETIDDWLRAVEVMWDAHETPPERRERQRPHLADEFAAARRAGVPITFLAELDGRPAGIGRTIYADRGVLLVAGGVAAWARGRGVYRALVRARWDDAVARGTPALVTEALPGTSYPILKRLGFCDVCTIRRLEDPRP